MQEKYIHIVDKVNTLWYFCGVSKVNTPKEVVMQLLIRTPAETKEFLQKEAQKIGITMNALVLVILQNWIQEKKK